MDVGRDHSLPSLSTSSISPPLSIDSQSLHDVSVYSSSKEENEGLNKEKGKLKGEEEKEEESVNTIECDSKDDRDPEDLRKRIEILNLMSEGVDKEGRERRKKERESEEKGGGWASLKRRGEEIERAAPTKKVKGSSTEVERGVLAPCNYLIVNDYII